MGIGITNYFLARIGVGDTEGMFSSFHSGGEHALAGYGLGLRIEQLALVPGVGIGLALSALSGQNNGAKKYLRVRESFVKALIACAVLWLGGMLPITLVGDKIARIFTDDPRVVQVTFFYLFYAFISLMGYFLLLSASNVMSAMKHPWLPILLLSIRNTVLPLTFLPLFAYRLQKGIYGVFGTIVVSTWICALILLFVVLLTLKKKICTVCKQDLL